MNGLIALSNRYLLQQSCQVYDTPTFILKSNAENLLSCENPGHHALDECVSIVRIQDAV